MTAAQSTGDKSAEPRFSSVAQAITAGVKLYPDGTFRSIDRDGMTAERSFRETLMQAEKLLSGLQQCGARPGDALVIALADSMQSVQAIWAAALGGLVAVPFAHSLSSGDHKAFNIETLSFLRENFAGVRIVADGGALPDNQHFSTLNFDDLAVASPSADGWQTIASADDLRFAIPTSGTTGRPKLVGLTERAAMARWWPELPAGKHAAGFLSWSSIGHVMGMSHAFPNLPSKVHLDAARFAASPLSWLDALETSGSTHATTTNFGMSLVLQALKDNPQRRWRLNHVRKIGIGAEAISTTICNSFLRALLPFGLAEDALILGYGLTECGPVVGGGVSFSATHASGPATPPELDRPTKGHSVRIVGEDGSLLNEGEVGCVEVHGPTMTTGYIGDAAATDDLFTPDGWLRTGDLGSLRDGKLTIAGRAKETVVVNARKYTCQEIEAAIIERTDFEEVYAVPFGEGGEGLDRGPGAPCAVFVVTRHASHSLSMVAEAVRAATAEAFRFAPKTVAILLPGEVPRTAVGKVRRLAMRDMLADADLEDRSSHLKQKATLQAPDHGSGPIEIRIARIWQELLRTDDEIDSNSDFFALGGDSLLALQMSFSVEKEFGIPIHIERFTGKLSIAELASVLSGAEPMGEAATKQGAEELSIDLDQRLRNFLKNWPGAPALPNGFIRRVGEADQGIPVFWCMQTDNEARDFGETLGARLPAYAMRSGVVLFDYDTVAAKALISRYVDEMTSICPDGPLVVGGTCQGVIIALAITRRLVAEGRDVRLLVAADCAFAETVGALPVPVPVAVFAAIGSKFNPYRHFRYPEAGFRKIAPRGLRLECIDTGYAAITRRPAMAELARGVEEATRWAASLAPRDQAAPAPVSFELYRSAISSPIQSIDLRAGERCSVPLKLRNTSPVAWETFDRSGVTVGNHWLTARGEILVWADGRAKLNQRVEPGGRVHMTLDIEAPHQPGQYQLEIDMADEGIRWFTNGASPPLRIPVNVGEPHDQERKRPNWPMRWLFVPAASRVADRIAVFLRASKPNR